MATQGLLNQLAAEGRRGDTELVHVNPQEAQLLRSLGGSGTINPETGLKEYHWGWTHPLGHTIPDAASSATDYLFGGDLASDVGGVWDSIFGGDLWSGLGSAWGSTFGNEGVGGWLGDRLGIHGQLFGPGEGAYIGSSPGDDTAWESAAAGLGPMRESIGELEILRQQIIDSFETGTDIFNAGTDLYNQGTDAYSKGKGLLGQISRDALSPELRAYENMLGQSGSKFGVSAGPIDPRSTSGNAYNRSVFNARGDERSRRRGELSRQGGESSRQQAYMDSLWGVLSKARNVYGDWWGGILSPEYQAQAPSFEDVTAGMDWLTPPTGTTWQPNYPGSVPQ